MARMEGISRGIKDLRRKEKIRIFGECCHKKKDQ